MKYWVNIEKNPPQSPLTELAKAKNELSRTTNNVLVGELRSGDNLDAISFDIYAPLLDVRISLFSFEINANRFPITLFFQEKETILNSNDELSAKLSEMISSTYVTSKVSQLWQLSANVKKGKVKYVDAYVRNNYKDELT